MPRITLTKALKKEYERLYDRMEIRLSILTNLNRRVDTILEYKSRYDAVGRPLKIPWYLIGIIHTMESGQDFSKHLYNGDPLNDRTTHVPKGRPKTGTPPFTWEESATDTLKYHRLNRIKKWDLPRLLYEFERYNGWGYRLYHPYVLSPYLWAGSNHYNQGKYVVDGRWSETKVSRQIGAAVLLRRFEERGEIKISADSTTKGSFFRYSNQVQPRGADLQRFLNTFEGTTLLVDGIPGEKTSRAVKETFGHFLPDTPD